VGTLAQKFYPHTVDHDGTWGTDARKLNDVSGNAADTTTIANFGTDTAQGTIVFDPYTNRSTRGTANEADFGWGINAAGSDGMASTSSAKRIIPAGDWHFNARVSVSSAQTGIGNSNSTFTAVVYRVSSAGTRTELFRQASATVAITSVTGVSVQGVFWVSSQSQFTFEADETVFVSFQVLSVGVVVTGQRMTFRTQGNDGTDGNNVWVNLPSPGVRTLYPLSTQTATGVGTMSRGMTVAPVVKTATGKGTAAMTRGPLALTRNPVATGVGTAARGAFTVTKVTQTATGVGTGTGRIEVPLDEIPEGSGTTIKRRYIIED
jgi:hypothetical protein